MTTSPTPKLWFSRDPAFYLFVGFLLVYLTGIIGWAFHQSSQLSQPADPMAEITVAPEPAVVAPSAPEENTFEPVSVAADLPTARVLTNSTLYGMAKRLCGDGKQWRDIMTLNPGIDPGRLQVNQELKLPADCQADTRSVSPVKQVITKPVPAPPKKQSKPVVPDDVPSDDELSPPELPAVADLVEEDEELLPAAVTVESNPQWPACNGENYTDEYFVSVTHAPRLEEMDKWATYCRRQAGAVTTAQIDRANQLIAGWEEIAHFAFGRPFMGGEYRQARATIRGLRHSKRSNVFDASYTLLVSAPVPDLEGLWSVYGQRSAHSKWARTFFPYVKQYGEASDEPIVEERPRSKKKGTPAGSE